MHGLHKLKETGWSMDPLDWQDAIRRLQRNPDPNQQSITNNNIESVSRTSNDWDTCCQYSKYIDEEPQCSMEVPSGSRELGPPSHHLYIRESVGESPDGEPIETPEKTDLELSRKLKELRNIEEQIMRKKVAIALKKEPSVKVTSPPGLPCNEQSATCRGATLKDRVNAILHQQHPVSFLSKVSNRFTDHIISCLRLRLVYFGNTVLLACRGQLLSRYNTVHCCASLFVARLQSPKDRMNSPNLSRDGLLRKDHPLKLRVKALMKQRCGDPRNREVCMILFPTLWEIAIPFTFNLIII